MIPLTIGILNSCNNSNAPEEKTFTGVVVYEAHAYRDSGNPFHTYVIYNEDSIIPADFYSRHPLNLGDSVKVKYGQNKIFSKMTTAEKEGVKTIERNINEVVEFKKFGKIDNKAFYDIQSKIRKDRSELQGVMDSIVLGDKK